MIVVLALLWSAQGASAAAPPNLLVSDESLLSATGFVGVVDQAEPFLAVDPANPQHLLGGAQEGRLEAGAAKAAGFYLSDDGGQTWAAGLLPGVTKAAGGPFAAVTDPVVAIGPANRAYFSTLGIGSNDKASAVLVSASADGGRSWGPPKPVEYEATDPNDEEAYPDDLDKDWLAVDAGPASPMDGNVYAAWMLITGAAGNTTVEVARSVDGGTTWSPPDDIAGLLAGQLRNAASPVLLVGPTGRLAVVYQSYRRDHLESQTIEIKRSPDGGRTWSRATAAVGAHRPGAVPNVREGPEFSATVDAATGTLYVVWEERREGRDRADLFLTRSKDGGRSWSRPSRIRDSGPRPQFVPAVAAAQGTVHVLYYEIPSLRRPYRARVVEAQSRNGGRTFPIRIPLTEIPFDLRNAAQSQDNRGRFLGDYSGLVATASYAQALWVDSRNKRLNGGRVGGNDVFTAKIPNR